MSDTAFGFPLPVLAPTPDILPLPASGRIRRRDSRHHEQRGLDVGVLFPVSETFSVTVASGLRYAGDLKDDDSAIGGLGLAGTNDTGSRLSVPLTASARWAF